MNKFEKIVLKKRNIWIHVVLSLITYFIWTLLYFIVWIKCKNKLPKKINGRVSFNLIKDKTFPDDYVVFDLETTGLDPFNNNIIEIGAIKYENNKEVDRYEAIIYPNENIPKIITEMTGLNNKSVLNGKTIVEELPNFIDFIGNNTLVAHNAEFDLKFILVNLKKCSMKSISNNYIDTLELARREFKDVPNHKLETLKNYLKIEEDSHRSMKDCYVCNEVYQFCKKH